MSIDRRLDVTQHYELGRSLADSSDDGRLAHPSPDHWLPLIYAYAASDATDRAQVPMEGLRSRLRIHAQHRVRAVAAEEGTVVVSAEVLIHVHDASNVEAQPLEFPAALVLALVPPLALHDHGPWLEWAPAAVEGRKRIYDLGRHLLGGDDVCVKADGIVVIEFVLRCDQDGWHLSLRGPGGVLDTPLSDFDPEGSTGLEVPRGGNN